MSDIIKIHNLPGIDDFGKSISEFSKSYSVAVSDTERKFSIKKNKTFYKKKFFIKYLKS